MLGPKRSRAGALRKAAEDHQAQVAAASAGAALLTGGAWAAKRLATRDPEEPDPGRSYQVRQGEPLAGEIRRIAAGRADSALEHLRGESDQDVAEAVHEARKDLKKLRAVLRLVRDQLGDELYRRENDRFRDAGRALAGARDSEVKLETLSSLRERSADEFPEPLWQPLREQLEDDRRRHLAPLRDGETGHRAVSEIEAGRAAIAEWPLDGKGWTLVESGLRRCYRRGRNRLADTHAEPSPPNVHEWRKRVKDLWYHLRLFSGAWPAPLEPMAGEAHQLSNLLGDHHDLAVLAEHLEHDAGSLDREGIEELSALIEHGQQELIEEALTLGERLYAEKPKAFSRRIGAYWTTWR